VNARNQLALGTVPASRVWSPAHPDFSRTLILDPLNQPTRRQHGPLVISLAPAATDPVRSDGSTWTVELRAKAGWDQAIPEDAVLVHQWRGDGISYQQPAMWSRFTAGQTFGIPAPEINLKVEGISSAPVTARIRVWDLPDGCLRKEDSKPAVYLIQAGSKRWITSPDLLLALGRSWSEVRAVPDAALVRIPDGPDVVRLATSVSPYPVPTGRPVQVIVTSTGPRSGAQIPGRVLVDGTDIGPTGTTLTHRFTMHRVREPETRPPELQTFPPVVTVAAPGCPVAGVDCGFPDR
jgi:hypothetical protein